MRAVSLTIMSREQHQFVVIRFDATIPVWDGKTQQRVNCNALTVERLASDSNKKQDVLKWRDYDTAVRGARVVTIIKDQRGVGGSKEPRGFASFEFASWDQGNAPHGVPPEQLWCLAQRPEVIKKMKIKAAVGSVLLFPIGLIGWAFIKVPHTYWQLKDFQYNKTARAAYISNILQAVLASSNATEYPRGPVPIGIWNENGQQFAKALYNKLGKAHAQRLETALAFNTRPGLRWAQVGDLYY